MAKRVEGENLVHEMLKAVKESGAEVNNQVSIKPSVLFESLVAKFWDYDADDFRTNSGHLISRGLIYLDIDGHLVLNNLGQQQVELNKDS